MSLWSGNTIDLLLTGVCGYAGYKLGDKYFDGQPELPIYEARLRDIAVVQTRMRWHANYIYRLYIIANGSRPMVLRTQNYVELTAVMMAAQTYHAGAAGP